MVLEFMFMDGRSLVYDTQLLMGANIFPTQALGLVGVSVRTDDLSNGLWAKCEFFDVGEAYQLNGHEGVAAPLRAGAEFQLLDKEDLKELAWFNQDGKRRLWRCGDHLVNGAKFEAYRDLYLANEPGFGLNEQSITVFKSLQGTVAKTPKESDADRDRRIAGMIGWDYDELMTIISLWEAGMLDSNRAEGADVAVGEGYQAKLNAGYDDQETFDEADE